MGGDNRTFCIHSQTISAGEGDCFYPNIMSTSNDMPAPASAMVSTPTQADGVAASRSTVDIELVCVKGERNSERSRKSWASREMMDEKGESDHDKDRIDGNRRASKMLLGKEMV